MSRSKRDCNQENNGDIINGITVKTYLVAIQKHANNNTTLTVRAQTSKHFQDFDNISCSINDTIKFIFYGV
jgi:hypothetical protein